jgi:hypothetical protein
LALFQACTVQKSLSKYGYARKSAWDRITDLIDRGIISNEDTIYFIDLLSSKDGDIRAYAWDRITDLIDRGIISNEEVIDKK